MNANLFITSVQVERLVWLRLKAEAAKQGRPIYELHGEILRSYFKKNGGDIAA